MIPRRRKSREYIRQELLQEAARLWEYEDTDIALESFDPLVGLLLGAFAVGLEQNYQELENTQNRLLQRLVQLLVPEEYTGPRPAHSVMKAQIVDPHFVVTPAHLFSCQAFGREHNFSPIGNYPLYNIQVKKTVIQDKIKEYGGNIREVIMNTAGESHDCWIGLSIDDALTDFDQLILFFDWRNAVDRSTYLRHIADVKVSAAGNELIVWPGLASQEDAFDLENNQTSVLNQLRISIEAEYNRHFLRVSSRQTNSQRTDLRSLYTKCPPELAQQLTLEEQARFFSTELYWLKVSFPASLSPEAVYSSFIEVNAFPVANHKVVTATPDIRPFFNVFPLSATDNEFFLEVSSVETPRGVLVKPLHSFTRDDQYGYSIRQSGIARFDERDSKDILRYVTNLLRDENAMFMGLRRSELESDIEAIREKVERLNQAVPLGLPSMNYLIVRMPEKSGRLTIKYRTTQAQQSNKIPVGTKLTKERGNLDFIDDGLSLLLSTSGGQSPLEPDQQLPVFRKAMLSRDRIVTNEDVKRFCFAELGDQLKSIELVKGAAIAVSRSEGLRRTIDVLLYPNPAKSLSAEQWEEIVHRLESKLLSASNSLIWYRIVVKATGVKTNS